MRTKKSPDVLKSIFRPNSHASSSHSWSLSQSIAMNFPDLVVSGGSEYLGSQGVFTPAQNARHIARQFSAGLRFVDVMLFAFCQFLWGTFFEAQAPLKGPPNEARWTSALEWLPFLTSHKWFEYVLPTLTLGRHIPGHRPQRNKSRLSFGCLN